MAKNAQAEIITMGLKDEGGMIDEASGNEVPNGALKEEVRDDQAAMLSPGEFVIPAYAVRYVGVERLVKLLREAKQGMEQLDDIGLTGEPNADDAGLETAMLPSDMQEGESSAAFAVGGLQQPTGVYGANLNRPTQQQFGQQQFGQQQFAAPTQQQFAQPAAFAPSSVLASPLSAPQYKPTVPIKTDKKFTYPEMVYTPGPTGPGYGVAEYVGPDGKSIFITTVGGKPLSKIPPGFKTRDVYDKDKEEEKDKPPPTAMVRKEEVPSVDSFESPEGEEGGRVITPDSLNAAVAALSGTQSVTAASLASAAGLLGISGAGAIPILGSILGFGAKATVVSMLSQLGVIDGARKPDDEDGKRGNRYTNQELIDLVTQEDDQGRTLSDKIDLDSKNPKGARVALGAKEKAIEEANRTRTSTLAESAKAAAKAAAAKEFEAKVDRSQADANVAAAAGRAETAVTEDIEAGQMGPDLGDLGMEVSDPGSFSAPSDAGSEAGDAGSGDSGFDYGIDSYGFDNKGGLVKKRKRTAKKKKKKNSKGLVNKRKASSKKKKIKKGKGLASSK